MDRYLCLKTKVENGFTFEIIRKTTAKHSPRGGDYFFLVASEDIKYPTIDFDENDNPIIIEDALEAKKDLVETSYNEMVTDVYSEMAKVFDTTNDISATAFAATWEAMLKRPENYVDTELGLVDEAAVIAFAGSKIAASDTYGVFRLKRIAQFQAEKATILKN